MLLTFKVARVQVGCTTLSTSKRGQLKPLRLAFHSSFHTLIKAHVLCYHCKPRTHRTCYRCISQAKLFLCLTICPFHILPIMQQHICNNVILLRYKVDFKIQLCQTLQPMCLVSVEVGLDEDVNQRFMISVYVAHIAMQVMRPIHTTKVHTHEFAISYMVTTLSGVSFLL